MACLPNHFVVAQWEEPGVISVRPVQVKAQVSFMYPLHKSYQSSSGVHAGSAPGIKSFHRLIMGKNFKSLL